MTGTGPETRYIFIIVSSQCGKGRMCVHVCVCAHVSVQGHPSGIR